MSQGPTTSFSMNSCNCLIILACIIIIPTILHQVLAQGNREFWTTTGYQELEARKPRLFLQKPWKRIRTIIKLEETLEVITFNPCSSSKSYTISDKWLSSLFLKTSNVGAFTTSEGRFSLFHCKQLFSSMN
ncbi:uncharacterized protein M6D78_009397 [Vipera latastei]